MPYNKDEELAAELDRLIEDTAHWSGNVYSATVPVETMMQLYRRFKFHARRAARDE